MTNYEDKMKALKNAMGQIEKEFGKGTVMKMSEKPPVNVDVIPTGSIKLDKALGVGGYPKGRIVEIYGPESGGKCLTENNFVLTSTGYKTIKDIFSENGLDMSDVTKSVEIKYPLINMNGEIENTTHFTYNGKKKVLKITTVQGTEIECTKNHPLRVLTKDGYMIWKKAKDIKKSDILICLTNTQRYGNTECGEAYLLGLLIGNNALKNNKIIWSDNDISLTSLFKDFVYNNEILSQITKRESTGERNGSISIYLEDKVLINKFYENYGICPTDVKNEMIPDCVRNGTKKTQIDFIRGYFDCKSHINNSCEIEITSVSKGLIYYIRLMLKNLGIQSSICKKYSKKHPNDTHYKLLISKANVIRYIHTVGTKSEKIKEKYDKFLNKYEEIFVPTVPNIKKMYVSLYNDTGIDKHCSEFADIFSAVKSKETAINKKSLHKLLQIGDKNSQLYYALSAFDNDLFVYETVSSIEYIGELPTFDFAMEKTHSFICQGIINHNTTMALHAIAECQKKGGVAAFIDAEHALDPTYAQALGVDVDNMLICQPDCGEQALEVADRLIQSGAIDICVIDSVAALVPKKELEGDIGDSNIGLQARLMSQSLRKLASSVSKNNCLMIFINQLREKVGVMFGNPEVTTGGRSLKYYSSIRLDVRRTETVKEAGEAVSNKIKVKVVKNKVAPPFKEVITSIQFGKGLDKTAEILDLSVENGEILKSGSWFSLKSGERIGQGAENAKKYLLEHPEITQILEEKIISGNEVKNTSEENEETKTAEKPKKSTKLNIDIIDE